MGVRIWLCQSRNVEVVNGSLLPVTQIQCDSDQVAYQEKRVGNNEYRTPDEKAVDGESYRRGTLTGKQPPRYTFVRPGRPLLSHLH